MVPWSVSEKQHTRSIDQLVCLVLIIQKTTDTLTNKTTQNITMRVRARAHTHTHTHTHIHTHTHTQTHTHTHMPTHSLTLQMYMIIYIHVHVTTGMLHFLGYLPTNMRIYIVVCSLMAKNWQALGNFQTFNKRLVICLTQMHFEIHRRSNKLWQLKQSIFIILKGFLQSHTPDIISHCLRVGCIMPLK